jgi:hypothetical protein
MKKIYLIEFTDKFSPVSNTVRDFSKIQTFFLEFKDESGEL